MEESKRITGIGIAITALIVAGSNTATSGQSKSTESNRQKIIVVYATKAIAKNATIKDEDLQETWIYEGKSPQHRIQCRNFAVGNLAKYGLEEGQILVEEVLVRGLPVIRPSELNHTTCSKTFTIRPRKNLAANSSIEKNDLCTVSVNPFDAPQSCIPRVDRIVGVKTKTEIKEGQIITNELIEPARQKGEP